MGIGEVLWDLLDTGPQMGGAPANFAYHAHALGANSHAITRVGKDDLGRGILRRFRELGLPTSAVQEDESAPTGTAKVSLCGDGLAHFTIQENNAWDYLAITPEAEAAAMSADAICFGSLAQRGQKSRTTIQRLVGATSSQALRVFDINLRQRHYSRQTIEQSLRLANVLKLNDDELPVLVEMFDFSGSIEDQIERLAHRLGGNPGASSKDCAVVALTRGAHGSLLYRDGRWSDCASHPVEVVDTVGAGDSFTAALVLGLLHNLDLDKINSIANDVARYVCSQAGATPAIPASFAEQILNFTYCWRIRVTARNDDQHAEQDRRDLRPTMNAKDHLRITGSALRRWAIAQLQDSLAVGLLWFIGLSIIHVPWAPVWAIVAGVLQIIPHFGPILSLLGPVLSATIAWRDWRHPLFVLILYAVIVIIDGFLLQPYIMRRVARVPIWVSILFPIVLGFIIPFWGVLLAPPLLAIVYAYRARREVDPAMKE